MNNRKDESSPRLPWEAEAVGSRGRSMGASGVASRAAQLRVDRRRGSYETAELRPDARTRRALAEFRLPRGLVLGTAWFTPCDIGTSGARRRLAARTVDGRDVRLDEARDVEQALVRYLTQQGFPSWSVGRTVLTHAAGQVPELAPWLDEGRSALVREDEWPHRHPTVTEEGLAMAIRRYPFWPVLPGMTARLGMLLAPSTSQQARFLDVVEKLTWAIEEAQKPVWTSRNGGYRWVGATVSLRGLVDGAEMATPLRRRVGHTAMSLAVHRERASQTVVTSSGTRTVSRTMFRVPEPTTLPTMWASDDRVRAPNAVGATSVGRG